MKRRGTIFTYSVVRSAMTGFQECVPFLLALVEENGELRMAQVGGYSDGTEVRIGEEVDFLGHDGKGNGMYRLR